MSRSTRILIVSKLIKVFLSNNIMFLQMQITISVQETNKLSIPLKVVKYKKKNPIRMRINTIINNILECNN